MPISLPKYIDTTGIIDHPIEHSWDDDDPEFVYARLDERLQHRIAKISDRGQLVLSCGFAEWIGWRLKKFSDDPMLFNKIEAVYAGIIDWRYLSTRKLPNRQDWKVCEQMQIGTKSKRFTRGYYSGTEDILHTLDKEVLKALGHDDATGSS